MTSHDMNLCVSKGQNGVSEWALLQLSNILSLIYFVLLEQKRVRSSDKPEEEDGSL